jgi:hypothetical protein
LAIAHIAQNFYSPIKVPDVAPSTAEKMTWLKMRRIKKIMAL